MAVSRTLKILSRALWALPALLAVNVGCAGQAAATGDVTVESRYDEGGAISTSADGAQDVSGRYADALDAWDRGEFRDAAELLRMHLAEDPDATNARSAEALLGRALAADNDYNAARSAFETLSLRGDAASLDAGRLYLAWVDAVQHGSDAGRRTLAATLDNHPETRIPLHVVVPGDEQALATLYINALGADAGATRSLEPLSVLHRYANDRSLAEWALAELATVVRFELTGEELVGCLGAAQLGPEVDAGRLAADSAIALCGAVLIERYIEAGDLASSEIALERAAPSMVRTDQQRLFAQSNALIQEAGSDRTLTWGAVLSLTGPDTRAGRAALGALLLAQRSFLDESPASELLIADSRGDREIARQQAQDLIDRGVRVLIAPIEPELSDEVAAVAADAGVAVLAMADLGERQAGAWTVGFSPAAEARMMVDVLGSQLEPRGTVVVIRDAGSPSYLERFAEHIDELGTDAGLRVSSVTLPDDAQLQQAARVAVQQALSARPDGIVLATGPDASTAIVAWLADRGVYAQTGASRGSGRVVMVANSFAVDAAFVRNSGQYADGIWLPVWFDADAGVPEWDRFNSRFEAVIGRSPGALEALAFSTGELVRDILIRSGVVEREAIVEGLSAGRFDTGTGAVPLEFHEGGGAASRPRLARFDDGNVVPEQAEHGGGM